MASSADTPRARQLGAELRRARDAKGLSARQLGKLIGRNSSHISRWENGRMIPSETDTATVLGVLGVIGEARDQLLTLAREAADPNWVAPGVDKQLAALMEYERTASRIVEVNPLLIPGLLQTADYARSIMLGAGATRGEADQRVALRIARREVLTRKSSVEFMALIGEHALRSAPCGSAAMADQLRHMLKLAELDNVTIQALRLGDEYSPALEGAFVLIEFEKTKPVVHLEHYRSSSAITDRRDIRDCQLAVENLRREAMSPAATTGLIADIADKRSIRHDTTTALA